MTRFGEFDDAAREYVISRPDTPLPWINYLGSEDYFGIISNTAGGYSFFRDARLRRLTRYRYNNVPTDVGGRYLYVRDAASGDFWSPSWQPTRADVEQYPMPPWPRLHRHRFTPSRHRCRDPVLRPARRDAGDLEVALTNRRDTAVQLAMFSAIEFCLWDAWTMPRTCSGTCRSARSRWTMA